MAKTKRFIKRYRRMLVLLLGLASFVAFFFTPIWQTHLVPYRQLNALQHIVLFLSLYMFTLAVHELTHFFAFIVQGVKMRAVLIVIFMFNKLHGRWRIHVRFKWFLLGGGFAVPDIEAITSQEELETLRRKFANALISAPIASLVLGIGIVIIGAFFMITQSGQTASLGFFMMIYTTLLTTLYLLVSLIDAGSLVGDFPAYKKMREHDFFAYSEIFHYFSMASSPISKKRDSFFLKDKLDTYVKILDRSLTTMNLVSEFLVDTLIHNDPLPAKTQAYVDYHIKYPQGLLSKTQDEAATALMVHIIYYLYKVNRENEALSLFERLKTHLNIHKDVQDYYIRQAEHLLNIHDHQVFLSERKHIKTTQLYWLLNYFEGYYLEEEMLNRGIIQDEMPKAEENDFLGVEIEF